MLEGLFDCILKKYSSIGSKKYYILLLWTRGALGGVWLELLAPWLHGQLSLVDINCHNSKHKISFAFNFVTRHCVRMSRVKVKVDFLENH